MLSKKQTAASRLRSFAVAAVCFAALVTGGQLLVAAPALAQVAVGAGVGSAAPVGGTAAGTAVNTAATVGGAEAQVLDVSGSSAASAGGKGATAEAASDGDAARGSSGNGAFIPSALKRNSFQLLVQETTGRDIPVFGSDLFGKDGAFRDSVPAPVSDDYVLGPGDEVVIRAWGSIDIDYRATVDRAGQISLPRVGVFTVAGSRASDLDRALKAQLSRLYKNYSLSVTVGKLRTVRLYAVGQARRPGVFEVSGNATFLSAVFASGGPNENGSMRDVQLRRGGKVIAAMDLYDFLLHGKVEQDVRMMGGDVLVFGNLKQQVALLGVVARQAIYELSPGSDSLHQLLTFSGGLPVGANQQRLLLERGSKATGKREVRHVQLPAQQHMTLHTGDVVTVLSQSNAFGNAVTLKGNVAAPLRYPYVKGMRVSDLIPGKEALLTPGFYARKNRLVQYESGYAAGQQREAAEVNRQADDVNWQHATVTRLDENLTEQLIAFNLYRAVVLRDPQQDLELLPGDVVTVYNQADVPVAKSQQRRMVTLSGEFSAAGIYQVEPGETLRELINRTGGITPNAYLYASVFSRQKVKQQQQKALDAYVDRLEKEVQMQAVDQSAISSEKESLVHRMAFQKQLVETLKKVEPNGRISMNMPYASAFADIPDIQLEDGDVFHVPARDATVSVVGAVYSPGSFLYEGGRDADEYVSLAGGAQRSALSEDTYVLHANGTVSVRSGWSRWEGNHSVWPGDAVVVPDDLNRYAFVRGVKDWTQIFHQFAMGIAGLKVLRD